MEPSDSIFTFAAFGTFSLVHSSEDQADYVATSSKPAGAGFSDATSANVDSLLGIQATAAFTSRLSAVVQLVSEYRYDKTFLPNVEWAYLGYQFTPDLGMKIGRTALPVFMFTDTRKVAYTFPWVRAPVEVYNLIPFTNNDGLDVVYRQHFGADSNTLQFTGGGGESRFPGGLSGGGKVKVRDGWNVSDTYETGFATLRANFGRARVTITSLEPLFAGLRQFGPPGEALATKYAINGEALTFQGLAASYDPGKWFAMAELTHVHNLPLLGSSTAWYVSSGLRRNALSPYLSYSSVATTRAAPESGLDLATLPPLLRGPAGQLNAALISILASRPQQATAAAGLRWDLMRNAALTLQYDHVMLGSGSAGNLINIQPGFRPGGSFNVFSLALDFVL